MRPARTLLRDGLDVRLPGEVKRVDHDPAEREQLDAASVGRRLLDRYWRRAAIAAVVDVADDDWDAIARDAVAEWASAERCRPTPRRAG